LVRYLNLLDQDVDIVVRRSKNRKHHGALRVVYA
jgi:hypothetical protein